MKYTLRKQPGFTFIELIIVIAIVSLISIITLTHYDKAMTSSKVSEAKELLRYTSVGIEAYKVDHGKYPYDGYITTSAPGLEGHSYWHIGISLTTPVAYLPTKDLNDPFATNTIESSDNDRNNIHYFNVGSSWSTDYSEYTGRQTPSIYYDKMMNATGGWQLLSKGPDQFYGPTGWDNGTVYPFAVLPMPYDPTNGLISTGDIMRTQKYTNGYYNVY